MKQMAWQNAVNMALGISLGFSPALFGYVHERHATTNAVVVGALIVATAVRAVFASRGWEQGLTTAAGLWLAASPWGLGFYATFPATPIAVAVGVSVATLSQWTLLDRGLAELRAPLQHRPASRRFGLGSRGRPNRSGAAQARRGARAGRPHT